MSEMSRVERRRTVATILVVTSRGRRKRPGDDASARMIDITRTSCRCAPDRKVTRKALESMRRLSKLDSSI